MLGQDEQSIAQSDAGAKGPRPLAQRALGNDDPLLGESCAPLLGRFAFGEGAGLGHGSALVMRAALTNSMNRVHGFKSRQLR